MFFLPVTVSTSVPFDGLLVTGLYTSTPVQSAPIPAPAAFGFGESSSTIFNMFFFHPDWKAIVLIQHTVSPSFLFNAIWKQRKTCWNVAAWSWPRPPLGAFALVPTKAVRLASPLQLWQAVDERGTTVPARGAFHWCFKKRKTEKRIRYEDRK